MMTGAPHYSMLPTMHCPSVCSSSQLRSSHGWMFLWGVTGRLDLCGTQLLQPVSSAPGPSWGKSPCAHLWHSWRRLEEHFPLCRSGDALYLPFAFEKCHILIHRAHWAFVSDQEQIRQECLEYPEPLNMGQIFYNLCCNWPESKEWIWFTRKKTRNPPPQNCMWSVK